MPRKSSLHDVPLPDLMAEITLRTIERDPDARAALGGLMRLLEKMAAPLSAKKRFYVSGRLRDLADELERRELERV
jgi:hypothetical protein